MGKAMNTEEKEEVTFEEAIQSLEQIVKDMEAERMPLDQLVRRYEEGSLLLRTCELRIREAEQRIELIAAGEAGPELRKFEAGPKEATGVAGPRVAKAGGAGKVALAKEERGAEGEGSEEEEIQLF